MMMPRTYRPNGSVVLTEVGDGSGVLLHLDTKFYYSLNATAVALWRALAAEVATVEQLARAVAREFRVDDATAMNDVGALLEELADEGLVERGGEGA